MRIVQLLPTMAMGDAIGNDVLALSTVIRNMGFQTGRDRRPATSGGHSVSRGKNAPSVR